MRNHHPFFRRYSPAFQTGRLSDLQGNHVILFGNISHIGCWSTSCCGWICYSWTHKHKPSKKWFISKYPFKTCCKKVLIFLNSYRRLTLNTAVERTVALRKPQLQLNPPQLPMTMMKMMTPLEKLTLMVT